jgi:hypothetical protein
MMPSTEYALESVSRSIGGGFFLAPFTNLRLTAFNSAAGVTLLVSGQILGPDGEVRPFQQTLVPTTARAISTAIFAPGCGWLLDAQIVASAGTPRRGQCFARLELIAGREGATHALGTVLQGYVQDTTALAWPGSPIVSSVDGPGVIRAIVGTDPAAGVEISETVPTNARWRLLAVYAQLVTAVAAANREPSLVVDDGANNLTVSSAFASQAASLTHQYSWHHENQLAAILNGTAHPLRLPRIVAMGGYRIRTATTNIQAADNWGAPNLLVEEWIED